jgi:NADPH:quinone reductase-like Zn-dependent oxidoreductase
MHLNPGSFSLSLEQIGHTQQTYRFSVIGGTKFPEIGTFAEYVVVERDEVIASPSHLDDVQTAAWPVGGLTAWRSAYTNPLQFIHPN